MAKATSRTTHKPRNSAIALRITKPVRDLLTLNAEADAAWDAYKTSRQGRCDAEFTALERRLHNRAMSLRKTVKARAGSILDRIGHDGDADLLTLAVLSWFDRRAVDPLIISTVRRGGLLSTGLRLAVPEANTSRD